MSMPEPLAHPNPYVGPRSFREEEADRFFGREREARDLLAHVISERLVVFSAQSGAGKSSLLQTRLIPGLRERAFDVLPVGRVSGTIPDGIVPDNVFAFNLITYLNESLPEEQQPPDALAAMTLAAFLEGGEVSSVSPSEQDEANIQTIETVPTVLIIDQFEEIFTTHLDHWQERPGFFQQLRNAQETFPGLWVVLTMREDYLAQLDPFVHLLPNRLQTRYSMQRMRAAAALEAIECPAARIGQRPFAPGVAEILVDDLRQMQDMRIGEKAAPVKGEFIEPVQLQVVCYQLWERLHQKPAATNGSAKITAADLEELVGEQGMADFVNGALRDYYEQAIGVVVQQTGVEERKLREWFSTQIITPEGTRGLVRWSSDSTNVGDMPIGAVRLLGNQFLLHAEVRSGGVWYELVHDRLIEPIGQSNAAWHEENRTEFQQQAERWRQKERPEGLLLRGEPLHEAEKWLRDRSLSPEEREFIEAGVNLRDRERKYRMWGSLGIALVLFVLLGFAVGQSWSAKEQSLIALSRQLAAQAKSLYGSHQYDLGLLLSMQAEAETSTIESRGALLDGLFSSQHISTTLYGHEETVWSVAFSPDGKTLASGSKDGAVILWDITTNPPTSTTLRGHTKQVTSVAFSPDGQILASGGYATIYLWDMTATPPTHITTLRGHTDYVRSVAFSPDGQTLASGSKDGAVILWDVATEQNIGELLRGHTNWVRSVAFSPDGQTLASGGSDQTVILWDITTITSPTSTTLRGHTDQVWSVAFSPDGQTLASGGSDQAVILWDITITSPTSTTLHNEEQERSAITSVAFSPDEQTLASGGNAAIYLWDIATKQPVGEPLRGQNDWVMSVAFSPDGKTLASGSNDSTIKLWNMAGEQQISTPLHGHTYSVNSVAFSPDGQTLASGSNDNTIRLWDTTTGQSVGTHLYSHEEDINSVAFRPDGQALRTLTGHTGSVYSVVFSPDGQTLASASGDHTVRLWRVADGQALRTLTDHTSAVWSVAFSPDGQTLASASSDRTVRLWRVADGQALRTLTGHTGDVTSVAFSPDGQTLASGGTDKDVILWDMTATSPTSTTLRDHTNAVNSVAFSPDGQTLASASCRNKNTSCSLGEVILWDIAMQQPIGTLNHTGQVNSVAFSPDGQTLASGSEDNTIGLWDIATQQQISEPLRGHTDAVNSVVFSPDGQTLASGSEDASIRLWVVSVESWKRRACFKVNRNLSQEEWQRYMGDRPYEKTCPNLPVGERVE